MLASSKPIHCFSPLSRKLDVGWPRIEDFQLRGHSCVNNVQRCLCHFYTWMRHSKQTATLLLTKRHANFDTSTSAKGYARVCTNCACAIVVLGILLAQARPTMPCIRLVIGASAASPTLVVKTENCLYIYLFIYIYIYIYGTCVFRICILPYLCAMQYFRIAYWVHVLLLAQETRLERLNSGNQRNRDLKTARKGRHY